MDSTDTTLRDASPRDRAEAVARLTEVGITVNGSRILDGVTLDLAPGEHLAVLGPNGSGKTTLLRILSTYRHPTHGRAEVLGMRFGRGDLRTLRDRIGFVSVAMDPLLHQAASALALVAVAATGGTFPLPGVLDDPVVRERAVRALGRVGAEHLVHRRVDTLSQGERQRVRIARALVTDPELLLLDEPCAGLDLAGREQLLADLDELMCEPDGPAVVLVTHHLEELPAEVTRAVLLREGRPVATGHVDQVLASAPVSEAFGLELVIARDTNGWHARRA